MHVFLSNESGEEFDYEIDSTDINRVTNLRYLGILFNENAIHIDIVVSKAYSMLGFMMRICSKFYDLLVLKSVYYSHVRSHLEYGSVVWYLAQVKKIESVQYKFSTYLFRKLRYYHYNMYSPYDFKIELLALETLETAVFVHATFSFLTFWLLLLLIFWQ